MQYHVMLYDQPQLIRLLNKTHHGFDIERISIITLPAAVFSVEGLKSSLKKPCGDIDILVDLRD